MSGLNDVKKKKMREKINSNNYKHHGIRGQVPSTISKEEEKFKKATRKAGLYATICLPNFPCLIWIAKVKIGPIY